MEDKATLIQPPLVSVVALSYNHENYLEQTLESIRNQSYSNVELIICDDFSTDGSRQKINDWVAQNNISVKKIYNEQNIGICKSLNLATSVATGKYISFIACDDIMLPDKLTTQVKEFEGLADDYFIIYSDAQIIDSDGKLQPEKFIERLKAVATPPTGYIFDSVKVRNFIPAMSVLLKREIFDKVGVWDEDLLYEDWDFWLRVTKHYKAYYSNVISVKYRLHTNNFHASGALKSKAVYENFKIMIKHLDVPYLEQKSKRALKDFYFLSDPRFDEMLALYINKAGNNRLSRILSLKLPLPLFKLVNRLLL